MYISLGIKIYPLNTISPWVNFYEHYYQNEFIEFIKCDRALDADASSSECGDRGR